MIPFLLSSTRVPMLFSYKPHICPTLFYFKSMHNFTCTHTGRRVLYVQVSLFHSIKQMIILLYYFWCFSCTYTTCIWHCFCHLGLIHLWIRISASKKQRQTHRERAGWQLLEGSGLGMEGSSKKDKGLMDMDNSVVIAGGWREGIRGFNSDAKNTIKNKINNCLK